LQDCCLEKGGLVLRRVGERVSWVAAAAILVIGITGLITYSRVQLLSDAAGWVNRTERVRLSLQRTYSTLQEAESAARGFLITHEEAFLEPYEQARPRLDSELKALGTLLGDSPGQLARTRELDRMAHARLDALDAAVRSMGEGTFVLPKAPIAASESIKLADAFRVQITTMQREEDAGLSGRMAAAARARQTALVATVSMSGVAAALVVLLGLVGRRSAASQAALEASEERLRLALEGAELGTVDHDLLSDTAVWNDRLYAITGHPRGTPVTRDIVNLGTVPEDWPEVERALMRARAERTPFKLEHRIMRASDGALRWISSHGNYVYDQDGRACRFIGVVQDITANRRLEHQVRQSQKLDALGTLAGGIAHNLNNILAVLRGNLTVIRSEVHPDHGIMPAVLDMSAACNRAAALVRRIITFGSAQDQGRKVMRLEGVVQEALQLLRATLPAQIEIRSQYAEQLPSVLIDPSQIHQIIANLGINSSQAIGGRPGLIEVSLELVQIDRELAASSSDLNEGPHVRLRFTDNGGGIPREIVERIFEPFFTTREPNTGTGLGLSVVRGILKNHDATITVYSEPQRGTRFHLYFPALDDPVAQGTPLQTPRRRGRGERILYLDDEESLVILAKRMLERMGYQVSGFNDSAEALAAFESAPQAFDLVLTDLSMPGMSGMDVSRKVLSIRPDIPVLLATGYVRKEDVDLARSIGVREVIWKPQTISEMGDLLAQQLEKLVPARNGD
jgi:PAS domain S-box-containing protein